MNPVGADRTQAAAPLSPSASPPPYVPGRVYPHTTPANREVNARQSADDELVPVEYGGHSNDETDQPEAEGSGGVRSRMSLHAHAPNG